MSHELELFPPDGALALETDARTGPTGQALSPYERACARLDAVMERLLRLFNDGSASLILELTRQIFRPVIGRARDGLQSETSGIREP